MRKEVYAVTERRNEAQSRVSALEKELQALNAQQQELKVSSNCTFC